MDHTALNLKLNKTILLLAVFLFTQCGGEKTGNDTKTEPKGRQVELVQDLSFLDEYGEELQSLRIAIADDNQERSQGLMDVYDLPTDAGMLFIFPSEQPQSFWMANTPLPLDIMYVNSDSAIVRIYHNTTPFSQTSLPSEAPAQFVIETNAGYSVANGITEGMKVRF